MYKYRKLLFSIKHPALGSDDWPTSIFISFLALEGSSIMRRLDAPRIAGQLHRYVRSVARMSWRAQIRAMLSRFWPGFLSILLVLAAHEQVECQCSSISIRLRLHGMGIRLPGVLDGAVDLLDEYWNLFLETAALPLALLALQYRYLRQLDWRVRPHRKTE